MKPKHIYWFAYYDLREPSVRYRGLYALQHFKKKYNINYSIVYPGYRPQNILHFFRTYIAVLFFRKKDSIIVFENIHTKRIYATALKFLLFFRTEHTLYDIDDADYLRFNADTIHYFMKKCEACSAGSRSIKNYAERYNPTSLLLTSPVIDHNHIKQVRNKILSITWIGYYNAHRESLLQLFFPAIKKLSFTLKLTITGVAKPQHFEEIRNYFADAAHVILEIPASIDWMDENSIYEQISLADLGVSPLLDTAFNRAKSAFKVKQYLSCGLPVIGNQTGENAVFIKDGVNGFYSETSESYYEVINQFKEMDDRSYFTLSQNARKTFEDFSIDNYCRTFLDFLQILS